MKTIKSIFAFLLLLSVIQPGFSQITSIANGNWTSPTTWGGAPPTPGSDVVINHAVTLDIDYGYASGSITINGAGALNGNSTMRALALINGGNGTLTVNGTLDIARVALFSGSVTNNGTFESDSLFNSVVFNNNTGATINAPQFMNNTGGNLTNNGTITSLNFLNIETVTNNNSMSANDMMNCKSFTNAATGIINLAHDWLNSDSLASPAVFQNNGTVNVGNNWLNTQGVNGSGKFCILNNTSNTGLMTGTFDFCDQTGGNIDANTGTIGPNITYCLNPCNVSTEQQLMTNFLNIFPNPGNGIFTFKSSHEIMQIEIFDIIGKRIYFSKPDSETAVVDIRTHASGVYIYKIIDDFNGFKTGKIVIK